MYKKLKPLFKKILNWSLLVLLTMLAALVVYLFIILPEFVDDYYAAIAPAWKWLILYYTTGAMALTAVTLSFRMALNVLKDRLFYDNNVKCMRWVSAIALFVSILFLIAFCDFYHKIEAILVVLITLFIAVFAAVASNLLKAATELREENDLTI